MSLICKEAQMASQLTNAESDSNPETETGVTDGSTAPAQPASKRNHLFQKGELWRGNKLGSPKKVRPPPPPPPKSVRELAREKTADAIALLGEVLNNKNAKTSDRMLAANSLLDRGWGKAQQTIEANVCKYDQMSDEELIALIVGKTVEEIGSVDTIDGEVIDAATINHHYDEDEA
jgi:hypothetical protein